MFVVVIESDHPPPDPAVVVAHLPSNYPAVKYLNPVLEHESKQLVLATRLIAAVRRSNLRRAGNIKDQSELITRTTDVLISGI